MAIDLAIQGGRDILGLKSFHLLISIDFKYSLVSITASQLHQSQTLTTFDSYHQALVHYVSMKSPPKTGSSGSSPVSKELALHPKKSGVTKSPTQTKKAIKVVEATEGKSPQELKKWQAFLDSAHNAIADTKTVQALLFSAIEEERFKKEAEEAGHTDNSARKEDHSKNEADQVAHKDEGESSEYDVKGLMAQIYQDLHNVAADQYSRGFASDDEDDDPEEASRMDDLLREVSAGVKIVISKFPMHYFCSYND